MKKRLIIWVSILVLFLLLHLISGHLHDAGERFLKSKLISILPEGSSIGNIEWSILSSLKADSVIIGGVGSIESIDLTYTPLDLLRRRIRNASLMRAHIEIKEPDSTGGDGEFSPPLLFVEDVSIIGGYLKYREHEVRISGKGGVFSTGEELFIDFFKIGGMIDSLNFNLGEGNITFRKGLSTIEISRLRVGKSEVDFSGSFDRIIEGEGQIYLSDITKITGIDAEGNISFKFEYDSVLTYEGESGSVIAYNYSIPPLLFRGNMDSVWVESDKFSGTIDIKGNISAGITFSEINLKSIKSDMPESQLSGKAKFLQGEEDEINLSTDISGRIFDSKIDNMEVALKIINGKYIFDTFSGIFNGGTFNFHGTYGDKVQGSLKMNNLRLDPVFKYLDINARAIASADFNFHDNIYGVFSFDSLYYQSLYVGFVDGNTELDQSKNQIQGEIPFVLQDIRLNNRRMFSIGETKISIKNEYTGVEGLFKDADKELEYSISLDNESISIDNLGFSYSGKSFSTDSTFIIDVSEGVKIENAVFTGEKEEKVNFSINLNEDKIEGRVLLNSYDLGMISEYNLIKIPVSGKTDGLIKVSGSPDRPRFDFNMEGGIKWRGMYIGDSIRTAGSYSNGIIRINKINIFDKKHYSSIEGLIDVDNRYIDMQVNLNKAGEWTFYTLYEWIEAKNSELTGNLEIEGKYSSPSIFGELSFSRGGFLLVKPGIRIENMESKMEFNGDKVLIEDALISLSEGIIKANGEYLIKDRSYSIDLNINKTPLNWQYVNSLIDGDISVNGSGDRVNVKGSIQLEKTTITMPFRKQGEGGAKPQNLFLDLKINASEGNVWIRNDMADMELEGQMGVEYKGGILLLQGNMSVKQGNFYYLYRSFDVVKGEFNFKNSPELNPNIDIKARTLIQGRDQEADTVFLDVSGTMKTPQFDLYSKPARSRADIMTLLSLNLSWEDLSSISAIEESVTETAFNYWVRQTFMRRFKDRFGIDLVQMRGEAGRYEVILGKYITDKLFVKARTDILTYGLSEIQAEYRLRQWGSIIAENKSSGETRLLFKFRWRY